MDFVSIISEQRIKKAYDDGEFNTLPGFGKPMNLDEDASIPEDLRMAHRLMKNAGYTDDEISIRKEIRSIEDLIKKCENEDEKKELKRNLNDRILKFNSLQSKKKINTNSSIFKNYQDKIENKLLK